MNHEFKEVYAIALFLGFILSPLTGNIAYRMGWKWLEAISLVITGLFALLFVGAFFVFAW